MTRTFSRKVIGISAMLPPSDEFLARVQPILSIFTFVLLLFAPSLEKRASAQAPEDKPAGPAPLVRPCSEVRTDPKPRHKDQRKDRGAGQVATACLEAKGAPLEIQEFFQSYIRAQGWRFSDEKIVADGWMFVRHLDKDELLQFAKEGRFAGRVTWTEGKALVLITTSEQDDGFTRTEVTARLQGFVSAWTSLRHQRTPGIWIPVA